MSCNGIKDPAKKARCIEAQRLLKKQVAKEKQVAQQRTKALSKGTKIPGTMRVGHGNTRDSITFNDGSISRMLKNKKL